MDWLTTGYSCHFNHPYPFRSLAHPSILDSQKNSWGSEEVGPPQLQDTPLVTLGLRSRLQCPYSHWQGQYPSQKGSLPENPPMPRARKQKVSWQGSGSCNPLPRPKEGLVNSTKLHLGTSTLTKTVLAVFCRHGFHISALNYVVKLSSSIFKCALSCLALKGKKWLRKKM